MAFNDIPKEMWAILEKEPLSPPPEGVVPNFEHPVWHGRGVVTATSVYIPFIAITGSMWVYAKTCIIRKWASDDSIFLVSVAAALGYIALATAMTCSGFYGFHAWEVTIGDITKSVLVSLIFLILSGPLTWTIKLSVFSFVYIAFKPVACIRILVYVGVISTGLYHTATAIVNGILCGPHSGQDRISYLAGMAGPKCGNPVGTIQVLGVTSGVINLACDVYLLVLLLPTVLKLNLPRRKKTGIIFIFLTGTGGCVMSALALYYRYRAYGHGVSMWQRDVTYNNVSLMTVSIVESAVGVMIPCLASLAKVFSHAWSTITSLLSSGFTGFRRKSTSDGSLKASHELKPFCTVAKNPDLDTIDKMMMQIRPSTLETHIRDFSKSKTASGHFT